MKSSSKEHTDIFSFLEWWERNQKNESVVVPEKLNAIQILSIHKSKGLEFPVVIFPFANETSKLSINHKWIDLNDPYIPNLKSVYLPLSKSVKNHKIYPEHHLNEINKSLLDLMNVLYVAFTRPAERLYVITEKLSLKKENGKFDSVPRIIRYYLKQKGIFEEEKTFYVLGKRIKQVKKSIESIDSDMQLNSFISEDWRRKLLISTNAPEHWDVSDPEKNKIWGNLIHNVLAKIVVKEDAQKVISQFVESGIIRAMEKEEVKMVIDNVMNHELAGQFFKEGLEIRNETEILLQNGNVLRPDRLIMEKDKLTVIDYKTGRPEEKHNKQIIKYANTMAEMGYKNIQKYLVYLNEKIEVIKVD